MKKQKIYEFIKSRGFYLSLLTGVIAIFALCYVYMGSFSDNKNKSLSELNNSDQNIAQNNSNENNADTTDVTKEDGNVSKKEDADQSSLLENDIVSEKEEQGVINNKKSDTTTQKDKKSTASAETEEENSVAAISQETKTSNKLSFDEEDGLAWPVSGDVIINYSMDRGVYFPTLGQYKCNPAVVISAKEGTKVQSAADGIITAVEENEETGKTVSVDIGNNYTLVYGQLKDIKVKKGDSVKESDVLGVVAQPTKYYVVEGENLYFQVLQNEQSVNPLYLLR